MSTDLAALLPHGDPLCLLDEILSWDDNHIRLQTRSHIRRDNPLREADKLHPACLVEYAAQGTAIHGALMADEGPAPLRLIGAVRNLTLPMGNLADQTDPLTVSCNLLSANDRGAIYDFVIGQGDADIASGRITLIAPGAAP